MRANPDLWKNFKAFFNKEENIDATGKVQFMRLFLFFGAPLDMTSKPNLNDTELKGIRYNDLTDNEREQKVYIGDFQADIVKLIDEFKEENENGLDAIIFSQAVTQ